MFGGDRELYYPFVTVWDREFQRRPDRHTLDRVLAGLIEEGKIKREPFSFSTSEGRIYTKNLVMLPHIDPDCPEAQELKQKIIECHPMTYVPDSIEVLPELRVRIENDLEVARAYQMFTTRTALSSTTRPLLSAVFQDLQRFNSV